MDVDSEGKALPAPRPSSTVPGVLRNLVRPLYGLPPIVFLLFRLNVAAFWAWGAFAKGPTDHWGCVPNGFCETVYLQSLPSTLPGALGQFASTYVLPNILAIEWGVFVVEMILTVTLFLGLFGRAASLGALLWSFVVSGTYVFQPGAVVPDSVLFILAQLILVGVGGGSLLTIDSLVQPRLERSRRRALRRLGWWMWPPVAPPPQERGARV